MRSIFLQKSYTKYGAEYSPRPFSEKWKLSISLDQLAKVSDSFFYCTVCHTEGYQNILKLGCIPLAAFLKNKKRSGTSLPILFSA